MDVPNPHVTTPEMRTHFKDECWRLMNHQDHDIARFAEIAEVVVKHLDEIIAVHDKCPRITFDAALPDAERTETIAVHPTVTAQMDTTKQSDPAEGAPEQQDEHSGAHF
jgi:hypothetical protein